MRALSRYDCALDPFVLRELVLRIGMDVLPRASLVTRFSEVRKRGCHLGTWSIEQGEFAARFSQGMIRVYRKHARSSKADAMDLAVEVPLLETEVVSLTDSRRADDRIMARFDLDMLEGEISVRWLQSGDRYQPIGLDGTKKLSDLLADRKVPSFERPLVPVVVDKRGILWPVGYPIAHRVRLTDRTRRVLEARLQEGSWKSRS